MRVIRSFLGRTNEVLCTSVFVDIRELALVFLKERHFSLKDVVNKLYDLRNVIDFKSHPEDVYPFLVSKGNLRYCLLPLLRIELKSWPFAFHLYVELDLEAEADASCSNHRRSVLQHAGIDSD